MDKCSCSQVKLPRPSCPLRSHPQPGPILFRPQAKGSVLQLCSVSVNEAAFDPVAQVRARTRHCVLDNHAGSRVNCRAMLHVVLGMRPPTKQIVPCGPDPGCCSARSTLAIGSSYLGETRQASRARVHEKKRQRLCSALPWHALLRRSLASVRSPHSAACLVSSIGATRASSRRGDFCILPLPWIETPSVWICVSVDPRSSPLVRHTLTVGARSLGI
jgi:hypothetical protein